MNNLLSELKITRVKTAQAVATTDVTSDAVDMAGFETVVFVVEHGAITDGTPDIHAQQSSDDGGSDAYSDLEGTLVTVADADDNLITLLEIYRPQKQYVKCIVDRAGSTGSVVDSILAIQGFARILPVTQGATVGNALIVVSPDEGTP